MRIYIIILGLLFFASTARADDFTLLSTGITDSQLIPVLFTCDGGNVSPELHWKNAPAKTQSFAVLADDIDSPVTSGGKWYGLVLYNIPIDTVSIPQGAMNANLPEGTIIGANSFDELDYRGPCPPDERLHHYVITVYALDINALDLPFNPSIDDVLAAIHEHALKQSQLNGSFQHKH